MSMIKNQISALRELAELQNISYHKSIINRAADTIEALSAKLETANEELEELKVVNAERTRTRSSNEILKEIREKAQELSSKHWVYDERHLIGKGIQCMCIQAENIINANMERSAEDCGVWWIPCKDRLPEEKINPITRDFCEYQVTFQIDDVADVRHYKFGIGHWWNGPQIMDEYVTAWRVPIKPFVNHL